MTGLSLILSPLFDSLTHTMSPAVDYMASNWVPTLNSWWWQLFH